MKLNDTQKKDVVIFEVFMNYQFDCYKARARYEVEVEQFGQGVSYFDSLSYIEERYYMALRQAQGKLENSIIVGCF